MQRQSSRSPLALGIASAKAFHFILHKESMPNYSSNVLFQKALHGMYANKFASFMYATRQALQ